MLWSTGNPQYPGWNPGVWVGLPTSYTVGSVAASDLGPYSFSLSSTLHRLRPHIDCHTVGVHGLSKHSNTIILT